MYFPIVACVVTFGQPSHIVNEDEELDIRITISSPSPFPIDVRLLEIDPPRNEIRIPAGATSAAFIFASSDDNICEDDETFNLTIDTSSLSEDCVVGNHGTTIVTIVDDDGEWCSLACCIQIHAQL